MTTQKARGVAPAAPPFPRRSRFTLRSRKKKDGVIQGKLRMRSIPGAFLLLGVLVVVVGTALAVAGYWPYRISRSSILGAAEGESISESQTSGWTLGAKGLLSSASLVHSERMKLLGPVIMGVGLFILICANTVLYENRDRETQMLLAQMRSVLCSVSAAVPSADFKEIAVANSMARHYQWVNSLPAAHLNILCVQQLASSSLCSVPHSPESRRTGSTSRLSSRQKPSTTRSQIPPPSLYPSHSNSCNSSQTDCDTQCGAEHGGQQPANSCLLSASSMSTLDQGDVPAVQPRRCHSLSYRTKPYIAWTDELHTRGEEGSINQPAVTQRDAASQVYVDMPWQAVDAAEEQTRRSWPRLDLGSGRRYLKLENKEDSVDRLLDQLEQQCYQWDKSFGSGPFQ